MASIEVRKSAQTGATSYKVVWRDNGRKLSKTFKNQDKAEAWKTILETAGHNTDQAKRALLSKISQSPKMSEIAEQHIARLIDVTSGTRQRYERIYANHIHEPFGDLPIDQISPDDIADWVAHLDKTGRSPKTIQNIHALLNSIFKTAVRRKLRPDNPCEETRLPRNRRTSEQISFLTQNEFQIILDETPIHYQPFVLFLVGTGLRFSEATALTSADFTDNNGEYSVSVQKAWKRAGDGTYYLSEPKTRRGRRVVGLSKDLALEVAPLVSIAQPGTPVFKMVQGGKMTSAAFYNRVWMDTIKRAQNRGLRKKPRIHDLRHTFASWMLAEGESMSTISYLMGHESESTTRNVYAHMMPSLVQAGAVRSAAATRGIYARRNAVLEIE